MKTPPYCQAGSISYREAQARQELSRERLVEANATREMWKVATAAWSLTAAYSKAWDLVFVGALADMTGLDYRHTQRGIRACVEADAIKWRPSRFNRKPSLVGLPDLVDEAHAPEEAHQESAHAPEQAHVHAPAHAPTPASNQEPRTDSPDGSSKTYMRREDCVECGKRRPVNANLVCEVCWKREVGTEWVRA